MFEVRPCARPGRVRPRDRRDRPVLRPRRRTRSSSSAGSARSRTSGCTPPSTDGEIVGGAGAFPFELSVPGGSLPCARRDRRRRLPDASPPRRPPLADGRAAARRPRARRADRGALGVRGDDLRPLRLRHRLVRRDQLSVQHEWDAFAGRSSPRDDALRHARRGAQAVPGRVRGAAARASGHDFARSDAWWEERHLRLERTRRTAPSRFVVLEADGEPQAYAVYRTRFSSKAVVSASRLTVRRGARRDTGGDGRDLALPPRHRLESRRSRSSLAAARTIRSSSCSPSPRRMRYRMGDGLWVRLVDVAAALSGRAYGERRAARARGARRGLPVERGTLEARGRRVRAHRRGARPRARRLRARLRLPRRGLVHAARARRCASRSCETGASRARRRAVRVAPAPVVPGDLLGDSSTFVSRCERFT